MLPGALLLGRLLLGLGGSLGRGLLGLGDGLLGVLGDGGGASSLDAGALLGTCLAGAPLVTVLVGHPLTPKKTVPYMETG